MSWRGILSKAGINYNNGVLQFSEHVMFDAGLSFGVGKGEVYYLDGVNGSDNNTGRSPNQAFLTLAYAYTKLTGNQHDTLILIGGTSGVTISDTLVWAKNLTHLIGVGAPTPNSRARITISGTDSAVAGLSVTGYGCIFSNIRLFQETSLAGCGALGVTGNRNYFYNVDVQGQAGALAKASATAYSLLLNGAEECRFEKCTIGLDTVVRTNGQIMLLDGGVTRCEFIDSFFRSACETATKPMVKVNDITALDRSLLFKGCIFYNFYTNHGGTLNECFSVPANCQTHDIILKDCDLVGIAEWESNDRGQMWINTPVPTAEDGGVMVEPVNT